MTDYENPTMEMLFCNLDKWRHFAGYPLEPRVDALLALFLPKAIEQLCGVSEMHRLVIPQFPLKKKENNQSYKVDFLALSRDGARTFLIELKTDMRSIREEQRKYLKSASERRLACVLAEFIEVAQASTRSRRKYLYLIAALSEMGLLGLPKKLRKMIDDEETRGSTKLIGKIGICHSTDAKIEVVFIQPRRNPTKEEKRFQYISFHDFADSIQCYGDLGRLLSCYLRRWKRDPASEKA